MMFFSGTVDRVIFADESQPFYIFKLDLDQGGKATFKGPVIGTPPSSGSWMGIKGEWVNDVKHGSQVKILQAPAFDGSWSEERVIKALSTNGVSGLTLRRLVTDLAPSGESLFDVLSDEKALMKHGKMTEFEAAHLSRTWYRTRMFYDTIPVLLDLGFNGGEVSKLFKAFGTDCIEVLTENPWAIADVGFTVGRADGLAKSLGVPIESPYRAQGVAVSAVREACKSGHTFLTLGQVVAEMESRCPSVSRTDISLALVEAHKKGSLVIDRELGDKLIYSPDMHKFETRSAERLKEMLATPSKSLTVPCAMGVLDMLPKRWNQKSFEKKISKLVVEAADELQFELTEDQRIGVENALRSPISVFSGLPGTGKTTSLKVLVKVLQRLGFRTTPTKSDPPDVLLLAPTGIAAKRMANLTGVEAYTVHRALGGKPKDTKSRDSSYEGIVGDAVDGDSQARGSWGSWTYGVDSRHPAQFVVVDESSMLDIEALARIVGALREDAHLVLMGDHAQLPSVGPGNVLRDLVEADIPKVRLTEIFRQAETSDIVRAAHAIHGGDMPEIEKDFSLIPVSNEDNALEVVKRAVQKLYDKEANFQVLSPRHAGTAGVTNLNSELRDMLNPSGSGSRQLRVASGYIREGDRVMITANDYALGIYNGDVGKVSEIDLKRKLVRVKIHGPVSTYVEMDTKTANRLLRLAYAQTIHKSQGQEYDIIIMPILGSFGRQLQRNLIYTAVTRAKKKVALIGEVSALNRAVQSNKESLRNSALGTRIATTPTKKES